MPSERPTPPPVTSPRTSRLRRGVLLAAGLVIGTLVAACTSTATAPRSPFDDRGTVPTVPPGVTNFPPPFAPPTLTPAPGASVSPPGTPSSPAAGDAEAATGAAIDVLANRMAVSATRLSRVSAEAVSWPDACLGASLPGQACAQIVTPGYRVVLRYDTGSTHEVRTGGGGLAVWVAQSRLQATVAESESQRAAAAIALTDASGRAVSVLLTPGTQRLGIPVGALKAGDRVALGVDDTRDGGALRAVWIARE